MIIALKNGKGYLLATDLFIDNIGQDNSTYLETDSDITVDNCKKTTLFGVSRCRKYNQLLRYGTLFKVPGGNRKLTMKYIVETFIPIFLGELYKFNYLPENKFPNLDAEVIMVKKDVGYLIGYDTGVMQIGNEEVIGKGAHYAYPLLRTNSYIKDPVERILDVFTKCNKRVTDIGNRILIFDSVTLESKEYKLNI